MTRTFEQYMALTREMKRLVDGGMNILDPVIRSICRKLYKLDKGMTEEDLILAQIEEEELIAAQFEE